MKQDNNYLNKNTSINEDIVKYPQIIPLLQNFGIHCMGCNTSSQETLEQGFTNHGYSNQEINNILFQINNHIKTTNNNSIYITESATKKFNFLMNQEGKQNYNLKIQVLPGGCAGFTYDFSFVEKESNNDTIIISDNLRIVIDQDSLNFLKSSTIDYVESLKESGFKIKNPNALKTCGCGNSFH